MSFRHFIRLLVFTLSLSALAHDLSKPDFKVVVTGGLGGEKNGYELFFQSPLFRLNHVNDDSSKLTIVDTQAYVYQSGNVYVYSKGALSKAELLKVKNAKSMVSGFSGALIGSAAYAIELNSAGSKPLYKQNDILERDLAAIESHIVWQRKKIGKKEILIFSNPDKEGQISWSNERSSFKRIPAVMGEYKKAKRNYVFIARNLSSTDRTFEIVRKLTNNQSVPTKYLDLGNTLMGRDDASLKEARVIAKLLKKNNAIVLGTSNSELRASVLEPKLLSEAPYVIAAEGGLGTLPPQSRSHQFGPYKAQFSALGHISESAEAFLTKGAKALNADEAIANARSEAISTQPDLVFGLAQSARTASKALATALFDAVFSLVPGDKGALPAYDEMSFAENEKKGLRSVSPLVRVSPLDVTEVSVWLHPTNEVRKIQINRHAVVGGKAAEVKSDYMPGLPKREKLVGDKKAWSSEDFDILLGQILLKHKGADVAVIERTLSTTPISSSVSLPLSKSLLNRPGRSISFIMQGERLRKIFQLIDGGMFDNDVEVVGATLEGPTVGQRALEDTEPYQLVTSEKVGAQIFEIIGRDSLFSANPNGLAYIELALKEKFGIDAVNKFKRLSNRPPATMDDRFKLVLESPPISQVILEVLKKGVGVKELNAMFKTKQGAFRPGIVLDVEDVDFGMNANFINGTNSGWNDKGGSEYLTNLPSSRLKLPKYMHILFNADIALKWLTEAADVALVTDIRFSSIGGDQKPTSDKFIVKLETRLPLERWNHGKPNDWFFSPLFYVDYETKIWPLPWVADGSPSDWEAEGWLPRMQLMSLFVGGTAISMTDNEFFRIGGVLQMDINQLNSPLSAFEAGVSGEIKYTWKLGITKLKTKLEAKVLFPFTEPNPSRLGFTGGAEVKLEVPLWRFLSLSILADVYLGSTMLKPFDMAVSSIFGFALTYSQNVKWIF